MENTERPLLQPVEIQHVDSSNFLLYLADAYRFSPNPHFGNYLNLEWCTDIFERMYKENKQGFVLLEEQRHKLDSRKPVQSGNPALQIAAQYFNTHIDKYKPDTSERAAVERASTVYMDLINGRIANTEIVEGDYETVGRDSTELLEIQDRGDLRLIDVHTHPGNTLFSPRDYYAIIAGDPEHNLRLFKAMIVLCPDIQIMAIPSSQTPIMPIDEATDFVQHLKDQFQVHGEGSKKSGVTVKRTVAAVDALFHTVKKDWDKVEEYAITLSVGLQKGEVDQVTAKDKLAERLEQSIKYAHKQGEKYLRIGEKIHRRATLLDKQLTVSGLIGLARDLNVKLYSSTNMQDFYEFSA